MSFSAIRLYFVDECELKEFNPTKFKAFHPLFLHNIFDDEQVCELFERSEPLLDLFIEKSSLNLIKHQAYEEEKYAEHQKKIISLFPAVDDSFLFDSTLESGVQKIDLESFSFFWGKASSFKAIYLKMFPLILFFIETASLIDLEDSQWGSIWMLERSSLAPIGICTYYTFKGMDLERIRLSQFLILPSYQRKGMGMKLYETFTKYIIEKSSAKTVDFTVEDPNEEFQQMREFCDAKFLLKRKKASSNGECKISAHQLEKVKEILDFQPDSQEYRLRVKKRLYRQNLDELQNIPKEERVKRLAEMFTQREAFCKQKLNALSNPLSSERSKK
jgi:hypothetical protein